MIPAAALLALLTFAPPQGPGQDPAPGGEGPARARLREQKAREQQPPEPPSEERIQSTCTALELALAKDADPEQALKAMQEAASVPDPRVVALLETKGLRCADATRRNAAVDALGRCAHPAALKALHEGLKRDRKALAKDPPAYAGYLKAIGRHGDASSIDLLTEDLFQAPDRSVAAARILGLGNIRSPAAVEALIQLMRSSPHHKVADHMAEFRLALARLTGEDKGGNQELWINWYGDHKGALEIASEPTELAPELQRRWEQYWGREARGRKPGGARRSGDDPRDGPGDGPGGKGPAGRGQRGGG